MLFVFMFVKFRVHFNILQIVVLYSHKAIVLASKHGALSSTFSYRLRLIFKQCITNSYLKTHYVYQSISISVKQLS